MVTGGMWAGVMWRKYVIVCYVLRMHGHTNIKKNQKPFCKHMSRSFMERQFTLLINFCKSGLKN